MRDDPNTTPTVAQTLTAALAEAGVKRIFGIPGGGSSLEIIEAASAQNIDFVLTRDETAAAIMAATAGELSGSVGVVLTGLGPGAANVVNGVAHAFLDRAPLLVLTDLMGAAADFTTHQVIDHGTIMRPIVKGTARLRPDGAGETIEHAIRLARTDPAGPVHLDLSAADAASPVAAGEPAAALDNGPQTENQVDDVAAVRTLLSNAKRPVVLAGLDARWPDGAAALGTLADKLGCPVLTTYKAKGALAHDHPLFAGILTGGAAEADCIARADLILLFGLDPVELIPQRWRYDAPVIEISPVADRPQYVEPRAAMIGPLTRSAERLAEAARASAWTHAEIAELREGMLTALASPPPTSNSAPITPQALVEAAAGAAPANTRVAVDAGAHMIPATTFWPACEPMGLLISNGLATMGYALPAAIASALHAPQTPSLALTGDGGLMMCLGELSTAVRYRANVTVGVFNDAALSLIDIKQQAQGRDPHDVRYAAPDFAAIARDMGCAAWLVAAPTDLVPAFEAAFAHDGPTVVDVVTDPSGYPAQLKALRG